MNAELDIWLIYGLAATGVVFLSLFGWNLVCAPYRTERDSRITAEGRLAEIEAKATRPFPCKLNEEQKSSLADVIRSSGVRPEKMNVIYWPDSECADFAVDIGEAIKQAG